MNIFLKLFLQFLKIGAVSFGGGYGMIPLVNETVVENGWLTADQFTELIGVAESTPGPIAINMATYVGSTQGALNGGFWGRLLGAACSTVGVVLPALIIMLIIAALIRNLLKYSPVQHAMAGVRPCVAALIIGTACTLALKLFFSLSVIATSNFAFDIREILIFAAVVGIAVGYKKLRKKKISPILLIVISAVLGILAFGVFGGDTDVSTAPAAAEESETIVIMETETEETTENSACADEYVQDV